MKPILTSLTLGLGVLAMLGAPKANADSWNERTVMSINEPVRVGGFILEPGQYVLKLMDSQAMHDTVAIYSTGETHPIGIVHGTPASRPNSAGASVTFYEGTADQPRAVRDWFFEGDTTGVEFPAPRAVR